MTTKLQKTERTFSSNRGSSSIMSEDVTAEQVRSFMRTSFYLPVDILKHPEWVVDRIATLTGEEFQVFFSKADVHCLEDFDLLIAAQFVAVSSRHNVKTQERFTVAKIWYGATK